MGKKFSRTKESYKNGGGMPPKQKRWPTTTKNGRDVEVEMLRVRKSINRALQSSNNNNNSREQVAKSHVYIMTARAPDVSAGVRKTSNSNQDIMVKVTTSVNISRAN